MKRWLLFLCLFPTLLSAETVQLTFPDQPQQFAVVKIPMEKAGQYHVTTSTGEVIPAQFVPSSKLFETPSTLHLVFRNVPANAKYDLLIKPSEKASASQQELLWNTDLPEFLLTLNQNGKTRNLVKFIGPKYDPKSPLEDPKKKDISNPTTKPYHHLFDPSGSFLLTNGPEGQFPHHRGIYFGFNKTTVDGKTSDTWHCRNGAHQRTGPKEAQEFLAGPVLANHTFPIDWIGTDGKLLVKEVRSISFYPIGEEVIVDFQTKLFPGDPQKPFKLDGDPQHAGFHFRANVEVEKTAKETYFLRPTGPGKKGEQINWEPKKPAAGTINNPWNAMSFVVKEKRFTVVYLDSPKNPKESRQSERTYGRIGTYFEYQHQGAEPLTLQYRLVVGPGERQLEDAKAMHASFTSPAQVSVK